MHPTIISIRLLSAGHLLDKRRMPTLRSTAEEHRQDLCQALCDRQVTAARVGIVVFEQVLGSIVDEETPVCAPRYRLSPAIVDRKQDILLLFQLQFLNGVLDVFRKTELQVLDDLGTDESQRLLVVLVDVIFEVLEPEGNDVVIEPVGDVQELDVRLPEERVLVAEYHRVTRGHAFAYCG